MTRAEESASVIFKRIVGLRKPIKINSNQDPEYVLISTATRAAKEFAGFEAPGNSKSKLGATLNRNGLSEVGHTYEQKRKRGGLSNDTVIGPRVEKAMTYIFPGLTITSFSEILLREFFSPLMLLRALDALVLCMAAVSFSSLIQLFRGFRAGWRSGLSGLSVMPGGRTMQC